MIPKPVQNASIVAAALSVVIGFSGCKPQDKSLATSQPRSVPSEEQLVALPLGDIAGAAKLRPVNEVANPLEGDAVAVSEGHRLFIAMNCAGCHGYGAVGNMGPNLTDQYWRYGGTPSSIYQSIYEGRPQGMPAWGRALPARDIWKLVAYIQSLGGAGAAQQYHAGLQGDHHITSTAPEAHSAIGVFDTPSGATALLGGDTDAPLPALPQRKQ